MSVKRFSSIFLFAALLGSFSSAAAGEEFTISFEWGNIPLCTSGSPNVVGSPEFKVSGVPAGTNFIEFVLVDLDVPDFDHGGGVVAVTKDGVVPADAFEYLSPCPPDGSHTYEWAAYAIPEDSDEAETLAEAFASREYPE